MRAKTHFEYCDEEYQIVRLAPLVALFNKAIDAPKMRVFNWIVENLNSDNQLLNTQKEIAKATKVSEPTISSLFRSLIANDFMKRQGHCFMVNPAIIAVEGDNKKNLRALRKYRQINVKCEAKLKERQATHKEPKPKDRGMDR